MPLAFAAAEARIGRAIKARLSNARMVVTAGPTVEGTFTRSAANSPLGGVGMKARDISFECQAEDLPAPVLPGAQVTVYVGDQLVTAAGVYLVRGEPTIQHETGRLRFDLEVDA